MRERLIHESPHREEMSPMRSWSSTNPRAGDSLHALRAAGSTVRPTQGTNAETSRHQCGRKDQAMNMHIYTPRLKSTGERLRLKLNDIDWIVANRYRGTLRVKGIVTDQRTGGRYRIKVRLAWPAVPVRCRLRRRFNAQILRSKAPQISQK